MNSYYKVRHQYASRTAARGSHVREDFLFVKKGFDALPTPNGKSTGFNQQFIVENPTQAQSPVPYHQWQKWTENVSANSFNLTNLAAAIQLHHAMTYGQFKAWDTHVDAKHHHIANLKSAKEDHQAANLADVKLHVQHWLKDTSAEGYRLTGLGIPKDDTDAIHLRYLRDYVAAYVAVGSDNASISLQAIKTTGLVEKGCYVKSNGEFLVQSDFVEDLQFHGDQRYLQKIQLDDAGGSDDANKLVSVAKLKDTEATINGAIQAGHTALRNDINEVIKTRLTQGQVDGRFNALANQRFGLPENKLWAAKGIDLGNSRTIEGSASSGVWLKTVYGGVAIGPINASYTHFQTTTPAYHMDKTLYVQGEIYAGANYRQRVYHTAFKPTAADVGAISLGEMPKLIRSDRNGSISGNLNSTGTVSAASLTSTYDITVGRNAQVKGTTTTSNLTVTSNAGISGSASIGALSVQGSATVSSLTVNDGVVVKNNLIAARLGQRSDKRVKTDFTVIKNALDKVRQLSGYHYTRTDLSQHQHEAGLIAQEVQEIMPDGVYEDNELLNINPMAVIALLTQALNDLVETLEKEGVI
ncbi:tail fiber domain-containing protein [Zooshikella marina]|uniref:tail fiber domain-containing protein n=1 Tax=Zooshikella ganghwensis TaxID=202772 RepID=UPI001BB0D1F2|nr:tail fiber domain-containing protein [Zooshikella ganghwensis]MBU2708875.1 tail fiber domain-containing protein [Zooshikella ganghwensis]